MKSRAASVLGSLLFLVLAPGTLALWIPWSLTRWRLEPPLLGWPWLRALGALLILLGLPVLLAAFGRFALEGRGTPAPILPPERLVVGGFYRYVRNPMYVAVTSLILGQALLLGQASLLAHGLVVLLAFHLFVLGYEEPTLRRRFGPEYAAYCAGVSRWLPRLRPWPGAPPPLPALDSPDSMLPPENAAMGVGQWFKVSWNDDLVMLEVAPPGNEAWEARFPWSGVSRICFKAEDLGTSDGIYVFTTGRPESYVIPIEAAGGLEFWNEVIHRKLFDAELAIKAASASEGLFCWPEAPEAASRCPP